MFCGFNSFTAARYSTPTYTAVIHGEISRKQSMNIGQCANNLTEHLMVKQTTMLLRKVKKNISEDINCSTHLNNIVSIFNTQQSPGVSSGVPWFIIINRFTSHGSLHTYVKPHNLTQHQPETSKVAHAKPLPAIIVIQMLDDFAVD